MDPDHLSVTFAALADPTRRAILARLAQGEATVGDLAVPFEMSAPAISKHLRVLARAGLITQGRDRQYRPCRIAPAPLKQAADWALQYRALWEQRLDQLDSYLQQLQQKPVKDARGKAAPKTTSKVSPPRTRKTRHHD
ncbi:ArsR/SmtB family transcription factor [Paraburkholderia dinghuensis]|uniref:Transcriptional regulator n=1 Tax=Paraburkholderia dinghuensis TaxID=2305225 RepID=A0A3N6N3W6_9BURK|nr:metalloregulator ArsR/SmtB family transcription factor [Paraburkholderia dinghuensis]RQH03592.1 transcriptional regulator [Paraburkholderia dinghuensis]